jgi:hypothetical protein
MEVKARDGGASRSRIAGEVAGGAIAVGGGAGAENRVVTQSTTKMAAKTRGDREAV